ncbi:MAG: MFS transporter [Gammaproteobacteria bacterium]|nr:MFS transporter [Gammaproteobacteria bacterium]
MKKNNHFPTAAVPLLFVILIDSISIGFFFPLLNALFLDRKISILPPATTLHERYLLYSHTLGIYLIMSFFGAPLLGDLSDHFGRRKMLCITMAAIFVSYLLSASAVIWHSVILLMVARAIAGFNSGNQSIAQASIIDLSSKADKTRNLAYMLFASSIGWSLGPLMGGLLSDSHLLRWFNFTIPFYFIALLSLLNVILVFFCFRETLTKPCQFTLRWYHAIELLLFAFRDRGIRMLSIIFLFLMIANGVALIFISPFLFQRYHYDTTMIALFWTLFSISYLVGFGYVVKKVANLNPLLPLVISISVTALALLLTALVHQSGWVWGLFFLLGLSNSVNYTLLLTLFSNHVDKSKQGWIMGVTDAIVAVGFLVATYLGGFAGAISVNIPLVIGAASAAICALLLLLSYRLLRT